MDPEDNTAYLWQRYFAAFGGGGLHWTAQYNDGMTNFMFMNQGQFDGMYGGGSFQYHSLLTHRNTINIADPQAFHEEYTSGLYVYELDAYGRTQQISSPDPLKWLYVDEKTGGIRTKRGASVHLAAMIVNSKIGGTYSIDNAVNWLNNNAHSSGKDSKGKCATYIRRSLEVGFGLEKDGFLGKTPVPARSFGPFLENQGFQSVNTTSYHIGDIAVIQGYPGGTSDPNGIPYGHIQMYNGSIWISDFKQLRDFWPGGGYRTNQPSFTIY